MKRKTDLFLTTLESLQNSGALNQLIIVGSWCHYFYREYFNGAPEIPAVRTLDIDLLVPNPPRIKKEVNIPKVLKSLDFIALPHSMTGLITYEHPELKLEFLTPDLGRGKGSKPYDIPKLHINAQGLRYLNLLQAHTIRIKYKTLYVRVPEPVAYVFNKFLVFKKRKKKEKMEKDLQTAKEIGEFLLKNKKQKIKLRTIFATLPQKWQTTILTEVNKHLPPLHDFLLQNKI